MTKPYLTGNVNSIDDSLRSSFCDLPADAHTQGDFYFRYRRHTDFRYKGDKLLSLEQKSFLQSKNNNPYAGGIERIFEPLSKDIVENGSIANVIQELGHCTPIHLTEYEIGVHQIRIVTDDEHMGKGAPEGIHQDGFDYEIHVCISKQNVIGGSSMIFADKHGKNILFEDILEPGAFLFLNDRTVYHYVTPITPKIPKIEAYRDMFIITLQKL